MALYAFRERKTTLPRHVIKYNSLHGGATYRHVSRDRDGNPEIVVMPGRKIQIRLDYAAIMDEDEVIEIAEAQAFGATAGVVYEGTQIDLTANLHDVMCPDVPGSLGIHITTSNGQEMTEIISLRPHRNSSTIASRHRGWPTSPRGTA